MREARECVRGTRGRDGEMIISYRSSAHHHRPLAVDAHG